MNSETEINDKIQPGPILVAADFSANSKTAVIWAIDLAIALSAPIVLVHIVHDRAEGPGYYRHDKKDAMRPMEDIAGKMMLDFVENLSEKGLQYKSFKNIFLLPFSFEAAAAVLSEVQRSCPSFSSKPRGPVPCGSLCSRVEGFDIF